jgi:hypothetical protein
MVPECVDVMLVEDDPRVRTMWSCQVEFLVFWSLSCKKSLRQVYLASGGPALASSTFCLRFLQVVRPSCLGLAAAPTPHTWGWTHCTPAARVYYEKPPRVFVFLSLGWCHKQQTAKRGNIAHCQQSMFQDFNYMSTLYRDPMRIQIRQRYNGIENQKKFNVSCQM